MLTKIKNLFSIIKAQAIDIWNRGKMVFLAIGALILTLEFQKLKEFLLVYLGQREIKNAKTDDAQLATDQKSMNDRANSLAKQAEQENTDSDWYKK